MATENPRNYKAFRHHCSLLEYGGPDGELGAALRYLSQKFTMVTPQAIATLNDVGTEELDQLSYQ